jgi:methionyl-tRNA formyltransferase
MSLRVVFAGTPEFAAGMLAALLESPHKIIGVYTQPDRPKGRGRHLTISPVKKLALAHALPLYQPLSLKEAETAAFLRRLAPDVMIVAAYGLILPPSLLEIPKYGCINVHASLLPRWRGAAPIQHALLAGDTETGITIMQMDKGLDSGDMLSMHALRIAETETAETLYTKLTNLGAKALLETLIKLEKQEITPEKQDASKSTYARKIHKEDAKIVWQESALVIARKIRAFNPSPIAYTELQNTPIRIWAAEPLSSTENSMDILPGTLIQVNKIGIEVTTGEGILRLLELQLPGGKRLHVKDILNAKQNTALFTLGAVLH